MKYRMVKIIGMVIVWFCLTFSVWITDIGFIQPWIDLLEKELAMNQFESAEASILLTVFFPLGRFVIYSCILLFATFIIYEIILMLKGR